MSFIFRLKTEENFTSSYNCPYNQNCDQDLISANTLIVSVKKLFWEISRMHRNAQAMKSLFSTFVDLGQHDLLKSDTIASVFLRFL